MNPTSPRIPLFARNYYQGNYYAVINAQAEEKDFAQLTLFQFRAMQELGKFVEANEFLKQQLPLIKDAFTQQQLQLWEVYSDAFIHETNDFENTYKLLDSAVLHLINDEVAALKLGLKARLIELGISFGFVSALRKTEALDYHQLSYDLYIKARNYQEALLTGYRMADLYVKGSAKNTDKAEEMLLQIILETEKIDFASLLIDARLKLTELKFDKAATSNTLDFALIDHTYREILAICENKQLDKSAAKVFYALGTLLLEYGYQEGISYLYESIERYKVLKDYTHIQQCWRNLSRWYMQKGEESETIKAEAEVNQLNKHFSIMLSPRIETMYKIFTAQKQGNAKAVYDLVEEELKKSSNWGKNQLLTLKANMLITMGRKQEGIILLKTIVADYQPAYPNTFLSDALFSLSNVIIKENYSDGLSYMKEAISIDATLENHYDLTQRYLQLASHIFFSNRPFHITEEVEDYLNKAEENARYSQKLTYKIQLGNVFQTKGQLYGIVKDFQKAIEYFIKAEELYASNNITPQLAFTFSQQGLLLLNIAREFRDTDLQYFEEAYKAFSNSEQLFQSNILNSALWRTKFHQALCKYELAQNLAPDSNYFHESLAQAEIHFQESAVLIDELRFDVDNDSGLNNQLAVSNFGHDKQEVYIQAFYANLYLKKDYTSALRWLERMKFQSFLMHMLNRKSDFHRNNTYENYKSLLENYSASVDIETQTRLKAEMDNLLSGLFTYNNLQNPQDNIEYLVDYQTIKKALTALSEATHQPILIIQYFCTPNLTLAFGIRSDWEQPEIHRINIDYKAFEAFLRSFFNKISGSREALAHTDHRFLEEAKLMEALQHSKFDKEWQVYNNLVACVKDWSSEEALVCFIPHGILHDLPLHTLKLNAGQYLIERNPVFYAPSLSVLNHSLQKRPTENNHAPIVFGNPTNDLPYAQAEAEYVSEKLKTKPLLNAAATKTAFLKHYPGSPISHFAGHGKAIASNGTEQYIVMANGEHITAREIFNLKTQAELIVLSGCQTGVNEYQAGDELFGLVRSILHSGADSLLVSLWAANDESTEKLFHHFYRHYPSVNKASALRQAMKALIKDGYTPFYWGAFVLVGKFF